MPAEIIIDIEGLIYVADFYGDDRKPDSVPQKQVPLDKLVGDAVSPDMLEDEPLAEELLLQFRKRLLLSLEYVDKALVSVRPPNL